MAEHESSLAVLVDFENMARPGAKGRGDFDIHLVLNRLADKGRVLVKRAYADWSRYRDARHDLQNAGLELIEMPSAREGAKNRADIKMAVDAMELAYSREHLDTFVIVSGDSDFTPLVGKLRELNKRVTGMGNRESSSELLIANCDEFIFYDSLAAAARAGSAGRTLDPVELLRQTLTALQREGVEWPLASVVKDSMRRKNPAFDENETGFSTFSKFLEDAQTRTIIHLQTDPRSGTYRVELSNGSSAPPPVAADAVAAPASAEDERGDGTRRRRRRRRGEGSDPKPDVFEFVVDAARAAVPDLPLDQPISYEDVILAGPDLELGADPGDVAADSLLEATDIAAAPADDETSTGTTRRRRRRRRGTDGGDAPGTEGAPEPDAPITDVNAPVPATEAPATEAPAAPPTEGAGEGEGRSRRRRRRAGAGAPAPVDAEAVPGVPAAEVPAPVAEVPATETPAGPDDDGVAPGVTPEPDADVAPGVTPEPDADVAPGVTPEPDADVTPARRRVPRGSRRAGVGAEPAPPVAEAPAGEIPAPTPTGEIPAPATAGVVPAPAADEAPKPKRTRRTKAQIEADKAAAEATAQPGTQTTADEAPKPKRTRRTKAQIEADKAAAEATAQPGTQTTADEAPKPKRTRRTKAQIEADKAAAEATAQPGTQTTADEAPKPKRTRRTKAQIEADKAAAEAQAD